MVRFDLSLLFLPFKLLFLPFLFVLFGCFFACIGLNIRATRAMIGIVIARMISVCFLLGRERVAPVVSVCLSSFHSCFKIG